MSIGAVITAAGLSSRMKDFKPMMDVGSMSISRRVVETLRQGGAERIVVVTGHRAEELERHLARAGVVFLRNEHYATTQMFESARIGLGYIAGSCDAALFTPVDIPLFTASTVRRLIDSGADIAVPTHDGMQGHPILLSARAIESVLADPGEGGLAGALARSGLPVVRVPVDDGGILLDADTKDDYLAILSYHNEQLIRPTITVALSKERQIFDSRVALLLSLVDETLSMRAACTRMQMSYRASWDTINSIEDQLGFEVVTRTQGGRGGSRTELTDRGRLLLDRFRSFERDLRTSSDELFKKWFDELFS